MNLKLEPDHFINRSKESSVSSEKVRSLWDKKEKIRVVIEEPSLELIDRIVEGHEKRQKLKKALVKNWEKGLYQDVQYRKCKKEKESFEYLSTCPHDKEAWAKKEEEIFDSIKEKLKQKEKINLGSNWFREVFILRDKEEYRNQHMK
ncbi:31669_t:CDS:2 [Gigaspora margarita]|uniref:31669_t:CDS:1 n=1 Tax=Gigaspora margarita TaxID=4874 RepID=A0ABN7V235_GIGMA|nr:31669_t:CDS:2 [Gigaspora margarita]